MKCSMKSPAATLVLFICHCCQAQDFGAKADDYLKVQATRGKFMGSVLVARDGNVLFKRSYGSAEVEWEVPNTPQTKFNIASLTKQFTGLAILQLAERGKLKLEDTVSKYYIEAPAAWEQITLYHLLTHTSGIPSPQGMDAYPRGIAQPYTPTELIAIARNKPLDFPPGTMRRYSNSGYILLGYVIEQASGLTYADYIQQNVFEPLAMHDSGYGSNALIIKHRASGYTCEGNSLRRGSYVDWSVPYAAGALYSTVEDLFRWDQALYTERLLGRKWLDRLFTPDKSGYNYGWFIRGQGTNQRIYHEGSNPGFSAFIARYPADKTLVVVLSNLETAPVSKIADDLAALSFGRSISEPR
jgi:CubicO group peptidase (beta-lactamase class C family)